MVTDFKPIHLHIFHLLSPSRALTTHFLEELKLLKSKTAFSCYTPVLSLDWPVMKRRLVVMQNRKKNIINLT